MSKLLEYYKILGVTAGAGIVDITSSYKRLCRQYHPDINGDPDSEELMKRINVAYSALREKIKREAVLRERAGGTRPVRRYAPPAPGMKRAADAPRTAGGYNEAGEKLARSALSAYFKALNDCNYQAAFNLLSEYDRRHITGADFITWRKSVARLFPMRGFEIFDSSAGATVKFKDGKRFYARKYRIKVTEFNPGSNLEETGEITKLVISENGVWSVFLGYKDVGEVTRVFDERYEMRQKAELRNSWEEYYGGLYPEFNMLNLNGMRKTAMREIYRQNRYGGVLTFAAFSVAPMSGTAEEAARELLRSAARVLNAELRQTDIAAYAEDGVFAVLFVELKKKHASVVINRITEKLRQSTGALPGGPAGVECIHETQSGLAGMDGFNKVLEKFSKKL